LTGQKTETQIDGSTSELESGSMINGRIENGIAFVERVSGSSVRYGLYRKKFLNTS